jgi:hypothetical protein
MKSIFFIALICYIVPGLSGTSKKPLPATHEFSKLNSHLTGIGVMSIQNQGKPYRTVSAYAVFTPTTTSDYMLTYRIYYNDSGWSNWFMYRIPAGRNDWLMYWDDPLATPGGVSGAYEVLSFSPIVD